MDTNEVIIISEEADGTTTIVDIVETKDAANATTDSDGGSTILEVLEAILDSDDHVADSDATATHATEADATATHAADTHDEFVENADGIQVPATEYDATETAYVAYAEPTDTDVVSEPETATADLMTESETAEADFTASDLTGADGTFTSSDFVTNDAGEIELAPVADAGAASVISDYGDTATSETGEVDADAQANAAAASEAQAQADEAVAAGDFETAAQLRSDAEDYAYAANDDSMLHGSDSADLGLADYQNDMAEAKEQEVADYTAAGDYEAARDAAADATTYEQWADGNAGSSTDHSETIDAQHAELEWADWHQDIADDNQNSADAYAASGDMETAAMYQDSANDEHSVADDYGAASAYDGAHDTSEASYDASYSAVDTAYDSSYSSADTSYDSSYSSVDTSYDSE